MVIKIPCRTGKGFFLHPLFILSGNAPYASKSLPWIS